MTTEYKIKVSYKSTPMLNHLGGSILDVREGYARGVLPLSDKVSQPMGIFHAGALLTLADEMASTAINGSTIWGAKVPVAITLNASFLSSSSDLTKPIYCHAQVVRRGKNIIHVDTKILDHQDKVLTLVRTSHVLVDNPLYKE